MTGPQIVQPLAPKIWGVHNEFTAIIERDDPWYVAYCAELPGANGQGMSRETCLENLRESISMILEHRREETLRSTPATAERQTLVLD